MSMSTISSLLALPKPKKFDVQEYASYLAQLSTVDDYLVRPEFSINASTFAFEDQATYSAHLTNQTYFESELVLADSIPVTATIDGVELDSRAEILDASAGPFGAEIPAHGAGVLPPRRPSAYFPLLLFFPLFSCFPHLPVISD